MILNPESGLSFSQEKLLSAIEQWTTDETIISTIIDQGVATPAGLLTTAEQVYRTVRSKGVGPLTERTTAEIVYRILANRIVRRKIADQTARLRQDVPKKKAIRDLFALRRSLEEDFGFE